MKSIYDLDMVHFQRSVKDLIKGWTPLGGPQYKARRPGRPVTKAKPVVEKGPIAKAFDPPPVPPVTPTPQITPVANPLANMSAVEFENHLANEMGDIHVGTGHSHDIIHVDPVPGGLFQVRGLSDAKHFGEGHGPGNQDYSLFRKALVSAALGGVPSSTFLGSRKTGLYHFLPPEKHLKHGRLGSLREPKEGGPWMTASDPKALRALLPKASKSALVGTKEEIESMFKRANREAALKWKQIQQQALESVLAGKNHFTVKLSRSRDKTDLVKLIRKKLL